MGLKQSKQDSAYLPSSPISQSSSPTSLNINANKTQDPRSPAECRTPIYLRNKHVDTNMHIESAYNTDGESKGEKALNVLRKRFFHRFTNDPRSPSLNINRTPLVFEDTLEKSLSLDDTFADLFVESHFTDSLKKVNQVEETTCESCEQETDADMTEENAIRTFDESITAPLTPIGLQQNIDPRSPSIGVERTPIIFTEDEADEANENLMLESILTSLSLNFSASRDSSVVSMTELKVNANLNDKNVPHCIPRPTNKHLDRVIAGRKMSQKAKHRKTQRRPSQQQIYEDQENHTAVTPKLKSIESDKIDSFKGKRTPLSCLRNPNGMHHRSRSVESSAKSIKTRLLLTSFDDSLNPAENPNVPNLSIMQQCSQGSMEL